MPDDAGTKALKAAIAFCDSHIVRFGLTPDRLLADEYLLQRDAYEMVRETVESVLWDWPGDRHPRARRGLDALCLVQSTLRQMALDWVPPEGLDPEGLRRTIFAFRSAEGIVRGMIGRRKRGRAWRAVRGRRKAGPKSPTGD